MDDIDSIMDIVVTAEEKEKGGGQPAGRASRTLVGIVEHFYDKINVVAITLTAPLKVGDIIEIGDEENAVRQKVVSMQIERKDVEEAGEGDSVGIKMNHAVVEGSSVYRL